MRYRPFAPGCPQFATQRPFGSSRRSSPTGHQLPLPLADWASGSDGSQPLPAADRTGAIDAKQTYDFASGFSARAGSCRNVRSVSSVRARLFLRSAVTEARILART